MSSELTFGLLNGKLIHISEVSNGKSCNCVCPHCETELIARQGKRNSWCFAHENSEECTYGQESALHLFAKDVLAKYLKIKVPYPLPNKYKDTYIYFNRAELESRLNDIIPDVILYKGQPPNENPLLVEIKVTHSVDDIKLNKIKDAQLSAIEINLSGLDYENFDRKFVEDLIINKISNKCWLYNKRFKDNNPVIEKVELLKEEKGSSEEINQCAVNNSENQIKEELKKTSNNKKIQDVKSTVSARKISYKKMDLSVLLEKYKSIENGKLVLKKSFYKYGDENTVLCYYNESYKIRPEPNLCKHDNCNMCDDFISEYDLYDYIGNTCYMAIKCRNSIMKTINIITFLTDKLKNEEKRQKEKVPFITVEDVSWAIDKQYNYETLELLYRLIFQNTPHYATNNVLCVKDKFEKFGPVPNLCGKDKCGKWCKNFISIHQVKIQYFLTDRYVHICMCNNENTTKNKINGFIHEKIRLFMGKRYIEHQKNIRKQQQAEVKSFKEYLKNYK